MKNIYLLMFLAFLGACSSDSKQANAPKEVKIGERVEHNDHTAFIFYQKFPNTYNLKSGDYITMHYNLLTDKGDTISSSYRLGMPVDRLLDTVAVTAGTIEPILALVAPNDSLSIYVKAAQHYKLIEGTFDSLITPQTELRYDFKILGIKTAEQKAQEMLYQQGIELDKFVKDNKLNAQKTPQGLYIIETGKPLGELASVGDTVVFTYKTYDLEGKVLLDGSYTKPVAFVLGQRQFIPAWDIAFKGFIREGGTYTLLIPSHLCFGGFRKEVTNYENSNVAVIPPFTILKTDITLHKIGKSPRK